MDKRVRTGCFTCRKRRVKCDETKPTCDRCRNGNFFCQGYEDPRSLSGSSGISRSSLRQKVASSLRQKVASSAAVVTELSWRHINLRQDQLPLYHHFITTTVYRLFRIDQISFWRDQVAQMSYGNNLVYEALLAVGAAHRASLLIGSDGNLQEAAKCRILGLNAYGTVLKLLPEYLRLSTMTDTGPVVIVLLFLTYFECFMENARGAFRHLWAAIQLLRRSERLSAPTELPNTVAIYDAILRLDFLAQKLVPYACSSFLRCSDALMEAPFWNRPSLKDSSIDNGDSIITERYRLIQLICGHNKLSRIIWGSWYSKSERPNREELLGFYAEMLLWKSNSPATFASCPELDSTRAVSLAEIENLQIPPPSLQFSSTEAAVNVVMYNGYLGCALAMITTTDKEPILREIEAYNLVYQNLCICQGLVDRSRKESPTSYIPSDAINMGISIFLYHGARRCFSLAWQKWTISALRSIGREGLSNGYASANTLEIMCQLESRLTNSAQSEIVDALTLSLGSIRDRTFPLLLPRNDDDTFVAYYLRYGLEDEISDERVVRVVAKASWKQEDSGSMNSLKLETYGSHDIGYLPFSNTSSRAMNVFSSLQKSVENGWHGFLNIDR